MRDIQVVKLSSRLRSEVLDMISQAFAMDDPLARSQGIGEAEFRDLIDGLYDGFLRDGLSRVGIDGETNTVVGIVLVEKDSRGAQDEGSDAIAAIIQRARENYFKAVSPDRESLAHIHFVASHADFRQQGVVHRLLAASLEAARTSGCQRIFVEASGIRSRRLFRDRMNFTEQALIDYDDFAYQGQRPFRSIASHKGLCLLDRVLS